MKLRACAKINRSLVVRGSRPDGYHDLETVFQSLALHDTLHFAPGPEGLSIACAAPGVPLDGRNLAWQAARLVWQAAGRLGDPAGRLEITKRIPAQGGLGGGSADGAAALVGWDRLWGTALPVDLLHRLALALGADVPFFLVGGTVLGVNRGDHLRPLDDAPPRWVVLVFPPFGVSTPEAFRWWDEDGSPSAAASRQPSAAGRSACVNDLELPVSRRHPELLQIRRELERAGAEHAAMTGSGSTMFGLFVDESAARLAAERLQAGAWQAVVTRTATRGEALIG